MIPLRDNIRSHSFPVMTWLLIAANVVVFIFQASMPRDAMERLVMTYGMVPASINLLNPLSWVTLLTATFLHGGWFHLLSNMWTLYIFGDNVEDRMGSVRYLVFYLLGGIFANLLQAFVNPASTVPAIGASGAIAAVLGGYFMLFPRAKVNTLVFLLFVWVVELPALVFLGFWFISQLFSGFMALTSAASGAGGVAWWAHIGGFLFGLLLVRLFGHRHPSYYRTYPDEYWPY